MARAARQRPHFDFDVRELAVPAALALEARVLRYGPADSLAISDLGMLGDGGQAVFGSHPVERNLQVDIALAPQHELVTVLAVTQLERRVLLDHLLDSARELHIVGALLRRDRESVDRLRQLGIWQTRRARARAQDRAGADALEARQRHDLAHASGGDLLLLGTIDAQYACDTHAIQAHALTDRAAPHARQRELAGVPGVIGLDDVRHRVAAVLDAEACGRGGGLRRLVAERLQEAAHAMLLPARAQHHRHDQIALQIVGEVFIDLLLGGLDILQELLQQLVVVVRELLDQARAGLALLVPETVGQLDEVRGLAGLVVVGALAHKVDVAGDAALLVAQG